MRKIGLDFGTCNIKGSERKANGEIKTIKLGKQLDKRVIPNVVLYSEKNGEYSCLLGNSALTKVGVDEQDRVRNIKSHLQEKEWTRQLSFGKTVSASDVATDIMKSLYKGIHNDNKDHELSLTITVPVNFSKRQQTIVKKAAEEAGFLVADIITEPFASVIYLMQEYLDSDSERVVFVFDFGGGTLDLSLVSMVTKKGKRVIKTSSAVGITFGGNDINKIIFNEIFQKRASKEIKHATKEQDNMFHNIMNHYYIMEKIDEIKEEFFCEDDVDLDTSTEVQVILKDMSTIDIGEITVKDIYEAIDKGNWQNRIKELMKSLFEDSDYLPDEVTDAFFVGGSSSIPYFHKMVCDFFEENGHENLDELFEINDDTDFEDRVYQSVSAGAAIFGELKEEEDIEIVDSIPFEIYTKDLNNKKWAKISKDATYKKYRSPLVSISKQIKETKKIPVFQTIFGEIEKEVFLGNIVIDDDIIKNATHFCFAMSENKDVIAQFGHYFDNDKTENGYCIDWEETLKYE